MRGDCFRCPGSPLDGRAVPMDWARLDRAAKAWRLVKLGWALDFSRACSLLARHGAAVKAGRKVKAARATQAGRRWREGE